MSTLQRGLAFSAALAVIALGSVAVPVWAQDEVEQSLAASPPSYLPPYSLISQALDNSPLLAEAHAVFAQAGASARILEIGEHETSVALGIDHRDVRADGRYLESNLELSRGFRLPGKAALDRAAGQAGVEAARDGVEDARHEASLHLAELWVASLAAREALTIAQEELAGLEREYAALERRVELADASLLDLDQARGATAQARARLSAQRRESATATAALTGAFPELASELEAADSLTSPIDPSAAWSDWEAAIITRNHELTMARWQMEERRLLTQRAHRDRIADPTAGVRVFSERGGEETGVGVFLSIPLGGGRRAAVADREVASLSAAQARYAMVYREVRSRARADVIQAEASLTTWREAEAARDAAAQAEARIVRAYRLGERDLSDMLLGRRQMHEAQRFELVARAEANAALLKLALDAHELWLRD